MSPRRLVLLALVIAALAPVAPRAAVPVALYPVRVPGLSQQQRVDLHALLRAGLVSAGRRGVLRPRTPLIMATTCGETPAAACLARLAADGLILAGRGQRKGGMVVVEAALYDRNGARTREVRFVVDLVIENLRPLNEALAELEAEIDEDGTILGAPKPPPVAEAPARAPAPAVAAAPLPPPPAPATAPPAALPAIPLPPPPAALHAKPAAPTPTPPPSPPAAPALADRERPGAAAAGGPPAKAAPTPIDVSAPAAAPPVWKRQAGPFFTVLGGALLVSGGAVAIANRSLAHDLDAKRAAGTLTAADRASYDKVDRYNVLTAALLAGGGVSLVAGTWIWITAPARPGAPALAVAGGRF